LDNTGPFLIRRTRCCHEERPSVSISLIAWGIASEIFTAVIPWFRSKGQSVPVNASTQEESNAERDGSFDHGTRASSVVPRQATGSVPDQYFLLMRLRPVLIEGDPKRLEALFKVAGG
jgi:hypothetical protein